MNRVKVMDLGLVPYSEAWKIQTNIHEELKLNKKERASNVQLAKPIHSLIICEHPPVYTLGKSGHVSNLKMDESQLKNAGIEYYKINRGGDITYHGPGQLVVYPIFDLDFFNRDVHWYVRALEECVIRVLSFWNIEAGRKKEYTGVWIEGVISRKICAIGVHLSRWVTLHGLALNVQPNLQHFEGIIPCGIVDSNKTVTSMSKELNGTLLDMSKVKKKIVDEFQQIFNLEIIK